MNKKIAIIGPAYPWRGGIAHHTGSMAHAFREINIPTKVFSFSFQYPGFLYPGKSQQEIGSNPFPSIQPHLSIHTLNPVTWWQTYKLILTGGFTVCIFKYWHFYFAPCFVFIAFLLRKKNIKTVCIIDNLYSHEGSILDKIMARIFFHCIDFSVTQSAIVDTQFSTIFPDKSHIMIPHPIYDHFGPKISKELAREKLGLPTEKKILLFFGFIRPYKGLDLFLNIFPEIIKNIPDIHLVIVGECFGSFELYENIIIQNNLAQYITSNIGYIHNSQIPLYFSVADIFIMPYRSATNSGVMEIAKFYGLPVIASDIEAFRQKVRYNGLYFASTSNTPSYIHQIESINHEKFVEDKFGTWFDFVRKISTYI